MLLLLAFISIVAVTGLVMSAVVGQRRRAMDGLHRAHDELELRVSVRTRELEDANQALQLDILARSKLEDELRRSEEKFSPARRRHRDYAVFMLDPEGNVASWNAGAESIKGYKAEEIIGQHFSRFYPAEALETNFPQTELDPVSGTAWSASPPTSTVSPVLRASAAASFRASLEASFSSMPETSYLTSAYAIVPFLETECAL